MIVFTYTCMCRWWIVNILYALLQTSGRTDSYKPEYNYVPASAGFHTDTMYRVSFKVSHRTNCSNGSGGEGESTHTSVLITIITSLSSPPCLPCLHTRTHVPCVRTCQPLTHSPISYLDSVTVVLFRDYLFVL